MSIIVHETWNSPDDEELHQYLEKIGYQIRSEEEILQLDPRFCDVIFAESEIIEKLLKKTFPQYQTIPTYPEELNHLYRRKIERISFNDLTKMQRPIFVKPVSNNKSFTGFVLKKQNLFEEEAYDGFELDPKEQIYVSESVEFLNEYRLFIANSEVVGIVESSHFILDREKIKSSDPDRSFILEVLKCNTHPWSVIDIGQLSTGQWAVVEVNPPYALSSYDWPIEKYVNYCQAAWLTLLFRHANSHLQKPLCH
jgi:hypothetical protein